MSAPISTKIPSNAQQLMARAFLYDALAYLMRHPAFHVECTTIDADGPFWLELADKAGYQNSERLTGALREVIGQWRVTDHKKWVDQHEDCYGFVAHGAAAPYEMEYGLEHTHRQPHLLADIAGFYRAFGLQPLNATTERVDHISVECEFMYYLLLKQAHALQEGQVENAATCARAAEQFLKEHLGSWAPSFAMRLSKYAPAGLIKASAEFCSIFITMECQERDIVPGPQDLPLRAAEEKEDPGCMGCATKPEGECA